MKLSFQKFAPSHFAAYQSWFSQSELKRFVGEIDDEWLQYVLEQAGQEEYAIFRGDEMVGEIGITLPTTADPYYVITNLAVNPLFQSQGIGSAILKQLLSAKPQNRAWRCYIHQDNQKAQAFFKRNHWMLLEDGSIEEPYLAFGWMAKFSNHLDR